MKRLLLFGLAGVALLPQQVAAKEFTIKLMADEMKFEPAAVEVHAGDTVRFEVSNRGELLHEFGVGTAEEHAAHRRMMAAMPKTHDHGHDQAACTATGTTPWPPTATTTRNRQVDGPLRAARQPGVRLQYPRHYEAGTPPS